MLIDRKACPVCQSLINVEISTIPYSNLYNLLKEYEGFDSVEFDAMKRFSYTLLQCAQCEHIYQKQVPGHKFSETLYEKWINPDKSFNYEKTKYSFGYFTRMQYEVNLVLNFFDRHPNTINILDFGAGWGEWSLIAKANGLNVYACELSETRISNLEQKGIAVISLEEINAMKFDYIRSDQVFEHICNPKETLDRLVSLLDENGIIRIAVPPTDRVCDKINTKNIDQNTDFNNLYNPIFPLEHINCFTPKNLRLLGQNSGLEKFVFPLNVEYASSTNWKIQNMLSNIYKPIINNYFKEKNNMCFQKQ